MDISSLINAIQPYSSNKTLSLFDLGSIANSNFLKIEDQKRRDLARFMQVYKFEFEDFLLETDRSSSSRIKELYANLEGAINNISPVDGIDNALIEAFKQYKDLIEHHCKGYGKVNKGGRPVDSIRRFIDLIEHPKRKQIKDKLHNIIDGKTGSETLIPVAVLVQEGIIKGFPSHGEFNKEFEGAIKSKSTYKYHVRKYKALLLANKEIIPPKQSKEYRQKLLV